MSDFDKNFYLATLRTGRMVGMNIIPQWKCPLPKPIVTLRTSAHLRSMRRTSADGVTTASSVTLISWTLNLAKVLSAQNILNK